MIRDYKKLKPGAGYYIAGCYVNIVRSNHLVESRITSDCAWFFNQNVKSRRTILFFIGSPTVVNNSALFDEKWFIYFDSLDEIKLLVEKLSREIYDVKIWLRDGGRDDRVFVNIKV